MKFDFYEDPVPHCIVREYYPPDVQCAIMKELESLKPNLKTPRETGGASNFVGENKKSNRGMFLNGQDQSVILRANRKLFHEVAWELKKNHWFYQYLETANHDSTLVSYYENGDYYETHRDTSMITAIYYTWDEPKQFEGGDISLDGVQIPIENNCLLVFPSCVSHSVSKVKGSGRWAISQFANHVEPVEIHQFPNFLEVVDFKKVHEYISNSKWELKGRSNDDDQRGRFWYMDLIQEPFFREYLTGKIQHATGKKFKLNRVYANGQAHGQDGCFHQDDSGPDSWTFLLYTNEIENEVLEHWGGVTEFKTDHGLLSQPPVTNMGILFKSNMWHRGFGPSSHINDLSVTLAWKLHFLGTTQ